MVSPDVLLYALLGGILPVLLWLWFWLKEDAHHPEPRALIMISFIAGMAVVAIAIPLERLMLQYIENQATILAVWATIEELLKFFVIAAIALRVRAYDEPTDALMYMITGALGFAALENTLFLIAPFSGGNFADGALTGNLRYVGASLLHVAASGAVGIAIGLSYYSSTAVKVLSTLVGLCTAIALHTLFNIFIMGQGGENMFIVFLHLWIAIVIVVYFFDRLKRMSLSHAKQ